MKSRIKKVNYIYNIFCVLYVSGLCFSILYALWHEMALFWRLALILLSLGHGLFTFYTLLHYPEIEITASEIIKKSFFHEEKISIAEINRVETFNFNDALYSLGNFCSLYTTSGKRLDIPRNLYLNESQLMRALELKIDPRKRS